MSVDADNNVWVGTKENDREFDLLNGTTGAILGSFALDEGGYGGLVDGNGVLWSSTEGDLHTILRYDTKRTVATWDDTWSLVAGFNSHNSYGLGIDSFGNIWNSQWRAYPDGRINKLYPDGTSYFPDNPSGLAYAYGDFDRGVTVTPADNNIWIANSGGDTPPTPGPDGSNWTVTRLDNNGENPVLIDLTSIDGRGPTGVSVDAAGKVWVTCYNSNTAKRIDPANDQVDLTVDLGAGASPYNYSDMTGLVGMLALKYGLWNTVHDSGVEGARWNRVVWNTESCVAVHEPAGTSIRVQVRAADSRVGLTREAWIDAHNDVPLAWSAVGRFVEVRAILNGTGYDTAFQTPTLCDLAIYGDADDGRDCNTNGVPDSCEMDDCNGNCILDEDDIEIGTSDDFNSDGIPDECQVIYVDNSAGAGANVGLSWDNAYTDLQDALDEAAVRSAHLAGIWVAAGSGPYLPSELSDPGEPQSATFHLVSGVSLYGGFAGTEIRRYAASEIRRSTRRC